MKMPSLAAALALLAVAGARPALAQDEPLNEVALARMTVSELPNAMAIGDWDRDGRLDLVVANDSGARGISIFRAREDGSFGAPEPVLDSAGFAVTRVVSVDFDHDHRLDLALVHANGITILRGTPKGTFEWAAGSDKGEIDTARVLAEDDGKPHLPAVKLYANLLVVSHGRGELAYTNLALYPKGFFAQDPDGGEDGVLDDPFDHFVPD